MLFLIAIMSFEAMNVILLYVCMLFILRKLVVISFTEIKLDKENIFNKVYFKSVHLVLLLYLIFITLLKIPDF